MKLVYKGSLHALLLVESHIVINKQQHADGTLERYFQGEKSDWGF